MCLTILRPRKERPLFSCCPQMNAFRRGSHEAKPQSKRNWEKAKLSFDLEPSNLFTFLTLTKLGKVRARNWGYGMPTFLSLAATLWSSFEFRCCIHAVSVLGTEALACYFALTHDTRSRDSHTARRWTDLLFDRCLLDSYDGHTENYAAESYRLSFNCFCQDFQHDSH